LKRARTDVRPADENTLLKLMSDFLENPLQISAVGEKAREKVLHVFNRDKMIQGLLNAYTSILERSELTTHLKKPTDKAVASI
jgi:hypothetical protein